MDSDSNDKVRLADQSVVREIWCLHTLDDIVRSLEDAGMEILEVEEFRRPSDGQNQYVSIRGTKLSSDLERLF